MGTNMVIRHPQQQKNNIFFEIHFTSPREKEDLMEHKIGRKRRLSIENGTHIALDEELEEEEQPIMVIRANYDEIDSEDEQWFWLWKDELVKINYF